MPPCISGILHGELPDRPHAFLYILATRGGPRQRIGSTSVDVSVHADYHLVQVPIYYLGDSGFPFATGHFVVVIPAVRFHAAQVI